MTVRHSKDIDRPPVSAATPFVESNLIRSVDTASLLRHRDEFLSRVERARVLLEEAKATLEIALPETPRETSRTQGFGWIVYPPDRYGPRELDDAESIRRRFDAAAWGYLMSASGLTTFMDAAARKEWADQIDKCQTPELTPENVAATFRQLHEQRGDMFERGVVGCFRALSWDYKTNSPRKFGKRVVLRIRSMGSFDWGRLAHVVDLQRVFCVSDGKPEEDSRVNIERRLVAASRGGERYGEKLRGEHDDVYMHFRWFKNGNTHATFKRLDLVDQLNRIVARHYPNALPPAAEDR